MMRRIAFRFGSYEIIILVLVSGLPPRYIFRRLWTRLRYHFRSLSSSLSDPKQSDVGDYVLVEIRNQPTWVEVMETEPGLPAMGAIRSWPLPEGYRANQTVLIKGSIMDRVEARNVNAKILEDFFRLRQPDDPAFVSEFDSANGD